MKPIVNFYVTETPEGNLLKWVGNTKSNSAFTVLRSTDEINFEQLEEMTFSEVKISDTFEFLDIESPENKAFYQVKYFESNKEIDNSPILAIGQEKVSNAKSTFIRIAIALVLVVLSVFLAKKLSTKSPDKKRPPLTTMAQYVNVQEVSYQNHNTTIQGLGKVISTQSIDILSEVSGKIQKGEITLKKAIRFNKGALLFKIEETETILNLKSQRSNFQNAIALILPDMKLDFPDRFDTWNNYFNQIDISQNLPTLPDAATQREKTFLASRNLAGQFYTIKSQEERLNKYRVYAPYTGIIQQVYTDAGSVANPGTRVLNIRKTNDLELELPIRKEDIQWVKTGTKVKIYSEDKRQTTTGRVSRISSEIDSKTQSINVYVSINTAGMKIYEGMYLYGEVTGAAIPKAMEVNRKAIFDENKIFIVQDSTLKMKTVQIHKVNNETILFSGIDAGEIIATETFLGAVDGMKIIPGK